MAFAQKRSTCIGCKAVLKTDGVCVQFPPSLLQLVFWKMTKLEVLHITCNVHLCSGRV